MSAKLFLFGQFRWELSSGEIAPKLRDKTEALIAFIALSTKGVVTRQQAAALLWEDGKDPLASLRQSVREIKDMEVENGSQLFQAETQYLSLNLNRLWVDARIASQVAKNYSTSKAEELANCQLGQLLDGCNVYGEAFDDWLRAERSRRQGELSQSLESLLQAYVMKAVSAIEVRQVAQAILSVDPTNERAYRAVMKAFYEEGDRATALKYYETCIDVLDRELGLEPSEDTEDLGKKIQSRRMVEVSSPVEQVKEQQIQIDDLAKPVVLIQEFATAGQDPVLDFVAQTFKADISEQLSCNNGFSVREGILLENAPIKAPNVNTYIIRGNIINMGDSTTILLQLLQESTGDILLMKRLTPEMSSILSGRDEQAALAAIEMYQMIELKETELAMKAEDSMLTARQCLHRAISILFRVSPEATAEAKRYLLRALTQSPGYPEAMAWLAFLQSIELGQGYAKDPDATREETGELVRRSIELNPSSDIGLAIAGHLEAFVHHDFETALEYFDRSLAANPNCAYAWGFSAITHCYIGKPDKALNLLGRCRQIMPFDSHPYYFDTARCIASMLSGRYEDAVRIGKQVLRNNPNFHANYRPLISSLGHLGRSEEAIPVVAEFSKFQPDFSVSWHLKNYPPLEEEITERYIEGLRLAGVSED